MKENVVFFLNTVYLRRCVDILPYDNVEESLKPIKWPPRLLKALMTI